MKSHKIQSEKKDICLSKYKSMKSLLYSKSSFVIEHFEDFTVKLCEVLARERT